MNELYSACDGVTLPDGLNYDSITGIGGNWDDAKSNVCIPFPALTIVALTLFFDYSSPKFQIDVKVKLAVERCGCNHATSITRQSLQTSAPLFMGVVVLLMQLGI